MTTNSKLTVEDILPTAVYLRRRKQERARVLELKRRRRVEVGPVATFYFENRETMWLQVQEMLYIEKGDAAQIPGELAAYNPLIPNGAELVATIMFEIDDPLRRQTFLARLGGVENTAFFEFAGESVVGAPEQDVDRTTAQGKASSVQFVHFPFTREQIEKFCVPGTQVIIGFKHASYAHMAVMPEEVRAALAEDFD
ncbi:MAG TPA: DUF3501 family protein [Alphaproteobacteria bacterium]|nr:DUF3501 family protein [Alphaproteobacteria bacterium]